MAEQPVAPLDANVVELWKKYEDVAMHFNDLIMRWRLQAIGGLAGLVTLAGFVVGDAATLSVRYRAMLILSSVLTFAWVGVALIDLFYYRRLLQGAVKALLALEGDHPRIALSTTIENEASTASTITPWAFYFSGLLPLLAIMGWAVFQLSGLPAEPAAPPIATATEVHESSPQTRVKDRLLLEAIVNDYVMRRKAKGDLAFEFPFDFDYWTSAMPPDSRVIVYIYARPPVSEGDRRYAAVMSRIQEMFRELKRDLESGIRQTILAFPEFTEERAKGVDVVLRVEPRAETAARQLMLERRAR